MNCKPGDLAIFVKSHAGNEGRVVRCLRLVSNSTRWNLPDGKFYYSPKWEIDQTLPNTEGWFHNFAADVLLRPIRDQPGADETLLWAPVPNKQTEVA